MATHVLKHGEITDLILKAFYQVYGVLGYGFLEKVYENSIKGGLSWYKPL